MKKIIYTLSFLFIFILTSCEKDEVVETEKRLEFNKEYLSLEPWRVKISGYAMINMKLTYRSVLADSNEVNVTIEKPGVFNGVIVQDIPANCRIYATVRTPKNNSFERISIKE